MSERPPAADEPIRLAPYDSSWSARFEEEKAALEGAFGEWCVGGIHHVGSTAVHGLEAKPIIDILAGVRNLEKSRMCFEALARVGYLYAPYLPEEMHWFCKPALREGATCTGSRFVTESTPGNRACADPSGRGVPAPARRPPGDCSRRFRRQGGGRVLKRCRVSAG